MSFLGNSQGPIDCKQSIWHNKWWIVENLQIVVSISKLHGIFMYEID